VHASSYYAMLALSNVINLQISKSIYNVRKNNINKSVHMVEMLLQMLTVDKHHATYVGQASGDVTPKAIGLSLNEGIEYKPSSQHHIACHLDSSAPYQHSKLPAKQATHLYNCSYTYINPHTRGLLST